MNAEVPDTFSISLILTCEHRTQFTYNTLNNREHNNTAGKLGLNQRLSPNGTRGKGNWFSLLQLFEKFTS